MESCRTRIPALPAAISRECSLFFAGKEKSFIREAGNAP